jgi:phosphate transport system permease protein
MAASVDKMVADQGTVGARLPQGAPNRAQSEKAENALARRIALQDKFATGVLFAIVAAICVLLFSLIAYIVASGAGKLLDVSFLTGKPEQFKEGGGIGPELFNSFYLLVLTLLISVPIALGGAIYLTEYAPKNRLTHFVKTAIEALSSLPSIVVGLFGFLFFVLQMAGASAFYRVLWRSRCSICPFWCALFSRRSRLSPTTSAKAV